MSDEYKGFACTCKPEERVKLYDQLPDGATVENLLYEINMIGNCWVKVGVDQWWGVRTEGYVYLSDKDGTDEDDEVPFKTYIQADALVLGLYQTFQAWDNKRFELIGSRWTPSW